MSRDNLPPLAPGWDVDPLYAEPDPEPPRESRLAGCAWVVLLVVAVLLAALPQGLSAVPLDLAFRDRPRLADEATAQLPLADLSTQRGSRHPETGSRLGEREHLGDDPRVPALVIQNRIELLLERGTLGLGALLGGVREKLLKSCLDAGVGHLRCVHSVSPAVVGRQNVDDTAYVVNTQSGAIGTALVGGWATWYDDPRKSGRYAAAGPLIRAALGDWRGQKLLIQSGDRSTVVVLSDACACGERHDWPTLLDLSPTAFTDLAPLHQGLVFVEIELVGTPDQHPEDPPEHPDDARMRAEDFGPLPATDSAR